MKHLSALDATFLHLESPEMPMHVGGLNLIDLPEGYEGEFLEEVKTHIRNRLHLAPVFHQRLELMPFELANPIWVEVEEVDLDHHIRGVVLPKPGTVTQLENAVARLHSKLLDRARPLWELYVIEGLKSGQAAFYSKVHHAAIDGQAGVALANAILDVSPQPREVDPAQSRRGYREPPGVGKMVASAFRNTLLQVANVVKSTPAAVKAIGGMAVPKVNAEGLLRTNLPRNWSLGPRTLLNVAITPQRSFATRTLPLAEVKSLGKQLGATLNDMVLAICSGALRRYLKTRGGIPKKPLVAAVPVSLRVEGDTKGNNQITMTLCSLATDIEDPLARLAAIRKATSGVKDSLGELRSVIPMDFPSLGAPWLVGGLASLYARSRLADRIAPIANVTISNVPGPRFPLYLAGGKIRTNYPVSIVTHGVALNITVQSYMDSLDFGFIACRKAVPNPRVFAKHVAEAFQELSALAEQEAG